MPSSKPLQTEWRLNEADRHLGWAIFRIPIDGDLRRECPEGHWHVYSYEELVQRDKASPDIFWLWDKSLEDSANLPALDILALEIMEDLEAALDQFSQIAEGLGEKGRAALAITS